MVNKPLIRPYSGGGTLGGSRLTSHDITQLNMHEDGVIWDASPVPVTLGSEGK